MHTSPSRRAYSLVCHASKGFGAPKESTKKTTCPCGSGELYKDCCKRYHDGEAPETAEALMRSRYTAYSKGLVDYVVDTTHPENPLAKQVDGQLRKDVKATTEKITWDKLVVLKTEPGADDSEAFVTFQV